jgi:hypothetical protein
MRLSQLARKLEISPSELILFFEKTKTRNYYSHNNKVEEGDLKLALDHFSPANTEMDIDEETQPVMESKMDIPVKKDNNSPPGSDSKTLAESTSESKSITDKKEEIEVIRMPKIKLEGVKVVGKIDLPGPVKKVKDEHGSDTEDQDKESVNISSGAHNRKNQNSKKRTNRKKSKIKHTGRELSYEEKLKREEWKKIREQQKTKRLRKEQKKQHYIKNVQANVSPVSRKKKSRKTEDKELVTIKARPEYRNPIRKLWAWLNGEYD